MTHSRKKTARKKRKQKSPPPARSRFSLRRRQTISVLLFGLLAAILIVMAVLLRRTESGLDIPHFDRDNAYQALLQQCQFGPRVPGTEAHTKCQAYLIRELQRYADHVALQRFEQHIARLGSTVELGNIIADFNRAAGKRILLGAHWDSRPWADRDPDSSRHQQPVPGANDGASGVAVLLEIARILKLNPPPIGVDIVLFDGEDSGTEGQPRSFALGSQYFARQKDPRYRPMFGIILDMVGDQDLQIYQESHSIRYASSIVDKLWEYAAELGIASFIAGTRHEVFDDHVPLIEAGIPAVDLIDFDYPHWHTTADTPDKCSPASLEQVGKVVLAAIYHPRF